jgi:Lipocalin-like domain
VGALELTESARASEVWVSFRFLESGMKTSLIFLVSILVVVFSSTANAQCKGSLVGTWKLVSVTATTDKGDVDKAVLGQNPSGLLTYTADGRMMEIISEDGRKPLLIADRVAAPAEERAAAYSFMAYAGRYFFTCDKVVTHVDVASLQNLVNTDQTRFVTLQGTRLTVRTTPISRAGVMVNIESVRERLN